MDLRPQLLPPRVPPERIDALSQEIQRICGLLDRCLPEAGEAASAISNFNAMTGHDYAAMDFAEYYASKSPEEFAREAARPAWPRVPDITPDELVEVTQRILDDPADPDCDYYLLILQANVPHPAITGLIFHPRAGTSPTARTIIVEALSYRPITS
jgi:hypothetical protein